MGLDYTQQKSAGLGIGDVSRISGIPVHTIRYWEHEFAQYLRPSRTNGKQRRYADMDINKLLRIKALLWTQRYSIRAVKRILAAGDIKTKQFPSQATAQDTGRLLLRLVQVGANNMMMSGTAA